MSTSKTKHSAVGPYLGYGLQTVRLCTRLLTEAVDSRVFVEHDDDVSVHYADGSKLLEQTKSAPKQNPVADWSRDLWKAFHNWLEDNPPSPGSRIEYRLYVTPSHSGEYVEALAKAQTQTEVATLVATIKADAKKFGKTSSKAYAFAKRFLDGKPDEQTGLVREFDLIRENDPLESIRAIYRPSVASELLDDVCSYAIGEAKRLSDALLRAGRTDGIEAGAFQGRVRRFVQRINLPALFSFVPEPDPTKVHEKLASRPTFVRQLELIKISGDQQLVAVSDYLRAYADKTNWATNGVLLPDSLDTWNDTLVRRKTAIADSLQLLHGHLKPDQLGAAVYAECRKLQLSLDTKSVPDHFTHGCLNDLADRFELGWHPDYATLIPEGAI